MAKEEKDKMLEDQRKQVILALHPLTGKEYVNPCTISLSDDATQVTSTYSTS